MSESRLLDEKEWNRRQAIVGVLVFVEGLAVNYHLPFLGYLVASFKGYSKTSAGYVTGFIVSSYYLAQTVYCSYWGSLSDKYGRRPVLLAGLAASVLLMLLFGFSTNVLWAIMCRVVLGMLDGNLPVAKGTLFEAAAFDPIHRRENEAKASSFIRISWTLGTVIGPLIGGLLFDPCGEGSMFSSSGLFAQSIFCEYKALLPSLVCALIAWLVMVDFEVSGRLRNSVYREATRSDCDTASTTTPTSFSQSTTDSLTNTHEPSAPTAASNPPESTEIKSPVKAPVSFEPPFSAQTENPKPEPVVIVTEQSTVKELPQFPASPGPLAPLSIASTAVSEDDWERRPHFCWRAFLRTLCAPVTSVFCRGGSEAAVAVDGVAPFQFLDCFKSTEISLGFAAYVALATGEIGLAVALPLFSMAPRHNGGLGLNESQVAIIVSASNVVSVVVNAALPWLIAKLGSRRLYEITLWTWIPSLIAIPFLSVLRSSLSDNMVVFLLTVLGAPRGFAVNAGLGTAMVLISIGSPKEAKAQVMGYAQSVAAFVRSVGPVSGSLLFAWSISQPRPWLLSYPLVFLVSSIVPIPSIVLCRTATWPDHSMPSKP